MKCAIYARVSLEEARGQDLDRQLIPLRQFAHKLDYDIAAEFVEHESGADMLRPQFRNMLYAYSRKEFDVLLVHSLDRFARFKPHESMFLLDRLAKQGLLIYSYSEPWFDITRLDEETVNLHVYITFWKAWAERKKATERSKSGIANKKTKGVYRGGRPKGKKDSAPRIRRWLVKPDIGVENLVV